MTLTTLDVTGIAAGGNGVARADGLVVFTPRTAPGDRVVAEVTLDGRVGRGMLRQIERPGASRTVPRCAHYESPDRCGGCQLQHLRLEDQREAKRLIVRDAFSRIARREVPLPEIHGGEGWRYRRSLSLAIRRDGARVIAGMRAFDDPEAVFALKDCEITDERVMEAWRLVLAASRFLPPDPRLRGTIRWIEGRPLFALEGGTEWSALADFLAATPTLGAVWWQADGKRRRLIADRRPAGMAVATFVQVNEELATRMHRDVIARVMSYAPATVFDGYSGAGDTAVALAGQGVRAIAVELDADATACAASRLARPSKAIAARVEDVIARQLPVDVVVLNPPRAGVDARVTTALRAARASVRAIVYVSCDPATLARDVARLEGWRVRSLACYDMFPQTAHVESVCELIPEAA